MVGLDGFEKLKAVEAALQRQFVERGKEIRALTYAIMTHQHVLFIGKPGTAKTALASTFGKLCSLNFFYYQLNRFTTPDELVGPIDPIAFRQGRFVRMTNGRLPTAHLVLLDEAFRASSETLNAILSVMNERIFVDSDGTRIRVPLITLIGTSNAYTDEEDLEAFVDRFLIKLQLQPIQPQSFEHAIKMNLEHAGNPYSSASPILTEEEVKTFHRHLLESLVAHRNSVAKAVAGVAASVRNSVGYIVSDRTITSPYHLPLLTFAIHAYEQLPLESAARRAILYTAPPDPETVKAVKSAMYPSEVLVAEDLLADARLALRTKGVDNAKRLLAQAVQKLQDAQHHPDSAKFATEVEQLMHEVESLMKLVKSREAIQVEG